MIIFQKNANKSALDANSIFRRRNRVMQTRKQTENGHFFGKKVPTKSRQMCWWRRPYHGLVMRYIFQFLHRRFYYE